MPTDMPDGPMGVINHCVRVSNTVSSTVIPHPVLSSLNTSG